MQRNAEEEKVVSLHIWARKLAVEEVGGLGGGGGLAPSCMTTFAFVSSLKGLGSWDRIQIFWQKGLIYI